jgi:hypothetical protein
LHNDWRSSQGHGPLHVLVNGKPTIKSDWQVRVYAKDTNKWQKGHKKGWWATCEQGITKTQLKTLTVPLQSVMAELTKFFGPAVKLLAGQLDLDGKRSCWINPALLALLENPEFEKLVEAHEFANNGCNERQNRFFGKLEKMYSFDFGWLDPEHLFAEIEFFKKGFDVWI